MKEQAVKTKPLAWIWAVSAGSRGEVLLLLALHVLSGGSGVLLAFLLRGMVDGAAAGDGQRFLRFGGLLVGVILCQLLLRASIRHCHEHAAATLENRLKGRLFSTLLYKDFAAVTAIHSEEWMNRLVSDTAITANAIVSIVPQMSGMLVMLLSAVGAMLVMLRAAVWALLPAGAAILAVGYLFRKKLKAMHKDIREADGRVRLLLSERLSELVIVRSFRREKASLRQAEAAMEEHKAARMRRNRFSNLANLIYGLLMRGLYGAAAIYCAFGIWRGTVSYGTFAAVLQLVGQIQTPFANLSSFLPQYYALVASAERLMAAEAFGEDCPQGQLEEEAVAEFYKNSFSGLELQNVTFAYPAGAGEPRPAVVRGFSGRVNKGEIVGVMGPSGRGKSTLLKLLLCLYPLDEGQIWLEGAGQKRLLTAEHRGLFAYVPQGNRIFSGTLREALAFGAESVSEEALWSALEVACGADFVKALPEGLDTHLGERGAGLSEGQLQRLSIARAILSRHPVLLLDEATSALDEGTESRLLENLKGMTDRTVLIVTHRPKVTAICDAVWTLPELEA